MNNVFFHFLWTSTRSIIGQKCGFSLLYIGAYFFTTLPWLLIIQKFYYNLSLIYFRIVLEASYSLYAHEFFSQISTILTLAIVGTLINFGLIGSLLYFVNEVGALGTIRGFLPNEEDVEITGMQIFLFASLISAVDPVAVLAIFQEVHVNNGLYFLVFGESLLNGKSMLY